MWGSDEELGDEDQTLDSASCSNMQVCSTVAPFRSTQIS
jgi:hypothetical protein